MELLWEGSLVYSAVRYRKEISQTEIILLLIPEKIDQRWRNITLLEAVCVLWTVGQSFFYASDDPGSRHICTKAASEISPRPKEPISEERYKVLFISGVANIATGILRGARRSKSSATINRHRAEGMVPLAMIALYLIGSSTLWREQGSVCQ
jgi:hypothetical protein